MHQTSRYEDQHLNKIVSDENQQHDGRVTIPLLLYETHCISWMTTHQCTFFKKQCLLMPCSMWTLPERDVSGGITHTHLGICRYVPSRSSQWFPPVIPGKTDRITHLCSRQCWSFACRRDGNIAWVQHIHILPRFVLPLTPNQRLPSSLHREIILPLFPCYVICEQIDVWRLCFGSMRCTITVASGVQVNSIANTDTILIWYRYDTDIL